MASTTVTKAAEKNYVLGKVLKIALTALIVANIASFVFGLGFGLFSLNQLLAFLNSGGLPTALSELGLEPETTALHIVNLMTPPLGYALITAIFPFLGAWIYLSVPENKTTAIGVGSTLLYVIVNIVIAFLLQGISLKGIGSPAYVIGLLIGLAIAFLYVFLVMGIGFNLAKLFKLKPHNNDINLNSF